MNADFQHWPSGPMWLQEYRLLNPFLDHQSLHEWLLFFKQQGQVIHRMDELSHNLTTQTQHHHPHQTVDLPRQAWPMGLQWLCSQVPHWRMYDWRSLWHLGAHSWTQFEQAIPLLAHPQCGWIWWEFDLNDIYERSVWLQTLEGRWVYIGQSPQSLLLGLTQTLPLHPALDLLEHDLDVDPHTRHWLEHLPRHVDFSFKAFVEPGHYTDTFTCPLRHPTQPILALVEEKAWLDSGILDLRHLTL